MGKITLNKFRRVTSGKAILEEIDGLRFLAIFYVIVAHLHGFYTIKTPFFRQELSNSQLLHFVGSVGRNGQHGVAIFFIISGFILALPFAKQYINGSDKPISLKQYYLRRLTRLEPPYILALLLLTVVIVFKGLHSFNELFPHLVASLTYTHNIIYNSMSWVTPVAWSLEVEVQFYLLAPFLAAVFLLKRQTVRIAILGLGIILFAFLQETEWFDDSFALRMSLLGWFQYFLVGFILADIYAASKVKIEISSPMQIAIGALLLVGISLLPYEGNVLLRITYPILCFLFFMLVLHFSFWKKIFSLSAISIIGGMCYSIYLLHFATISFIGNYSIHYKVTNSLAINYIIQWFIILFSILIVSGTYFLLIEKPCMKKDWPVKLMHKLRLTFIGQPSASKG